MRSAKLIPHGWFLLVLLAAALLLAGCQLPIDDPYGAGQQLRELVDALAQDASEFVAGFCGLAPTAALASLAVLVTWRRRPS